MRAIRCLLAAILTVPSIALHAQTYPTRPLRMIIPAGPGGGVDTVAGTMARL